MSNLLLVVQFSIVICLVLCVLLQRSAGEGLTGLAEGGGLAHGGASTSLIVKITFFLAAALLVNSLCLAKLAVSDLQKSVKIIETLEQKSDEEVSVPVQSE